MCSWMSFKNDRFTLEGPPGKFGRPARESDTRRDIRTRARPARHGSQTEHVRLTGLESFKGR